MEAKLCKIESKYFILLKESQEPSLGGCGYRRGPGCGLMVTLVLCLACTCACTHTVGGPNASKQELVSQMLREALEGDGGGGDETKNRSKSVSLFCMFVCV